MKIDALTVVHGQYAINLFRPYPSHSSNNSLCNELLFMVLSYCDTATLLSLYVDPVWHCVVVDVLQKSHEEILSTSSIELTTFGDVINDITSMSFEDR